MSTESVNSSSATLTNLILKGDVMMGSADRDAGFCSGEDDEDVEMHLERTDDEDVRSPTDASEDSVEVKVRVVSPPPSSGRSPRKRKSAEPRRVPAKKRHRMLTELAKPETCPNTTDQSQKQPTSPSSHFRPWSLPSPSVSVKVERTDPTPPPPKQYHPIYGYEPVPQQDEPLSLVKSRPIDRDSIKQESSEVEDVYNRLSPLPLVKKKCTNYELENTNNVSSPKYSNSVKGCTSTIVKNEFLGDNLVKHPTNLYETDIRRLSSPGFVPPVVLFDPRSHDAQSKPYIQPDKSSKHIYYPYDPMRDFLNENSGDFSSVSSFKHKTEEKSDYIHSQTYEIKSKKGNPKHKQNSEQLEMYIEKEQFHGESSGLDKQNTIQRQLQNMDMRYTGEMSDNRESGSDSGQKNSQKEQRNYKNMTRERRIEANARERTRVHTISAAFDTLRKSIPAYSHNQKLSKLSVLRIACSYILTLAKVAGKDYSADKSEPSLAECVDLVSKTIQTEGKLRKRKDD